MQPLTNNNFLIKVNPCAVVLNCSIITLVVLASLAAAGHSPLDASALSAASIALGGAVLTYSFVSARGSFKKHRFELLFTAFVFGALIFVGIHGFLSALNAAQVGWGILGIGMGFLTFGVLYQTREKLKLLAKGFFHELTHEPPLACLTFFLALTAIVIGVLGAHGALTHAETGWAAGGTLLTYLFLRQCYRQRRDFPDDLEIQRRELLEKMN